METVPNCKFIGEAFEKHKIDGSILFLLDDSKLKEIGINRAH